MKGRGRSRTAWQIIIVAGGKKIVVVDHLDEVTMKFTIKFERKFGIKWPEKCTYKYGQNF